MEYFLLPEKIKARLPAPGDVPPAVLNSFGGLDGSSGECYLVSNGVELNVFSRKIGSETFESFKALASDPSFRIGLKKDKFGSRLDISCSGWSCFVKMSSFDTEKAEAFVKTLSSGEAPAAGEPAKLKTPSEDVELDLFSALLAAMMFVAGRDGAIDVAEDALIRQVAGGDEAALQAGLAAFKNGNPMELAAGLAETDLEARLCIVANMLDTAMADGVLRSSEQDFISSFANAAGVSEEHYSTLRDVLILKNRAQLLKSSPRAEGA